MTLGIQQYTTVFSVAAALIVWYGCGALTPSNCHAKEAVTISDFCLLNIKTGKNFHSRQHRGTGLIIAFGSIYCKPCIKLLPILNRLHTAHKSSPIKIVSVDIDATEDMQTLKKFAATHNIRFPFLLDTTGVAKKNRICILPTTLFIDENGTVTQRFRGFQSYRVLEKEAGKLKQSIEQSRHTESCQMHDQQPNPAVKQ
jgi:thiol-disulfide isomerase/thioredoxin